MGTKDVPFWTLFDIWTKEKGKKKVAYCGEKGNNLIVDSTRLSKKRKEREKV